MSKWTTKAKTKKKTKTSVNTNGEFTFKTVLGEKVVHTVHVEIAKLLALPQPRSTRAALRLAELFSSRAFFSQFPTRVCAEICKHITMTSYFKGQTIVNQGERGFDIYVINCGECVVKVTPKNKRLKPFIVMSIHAGGSFGKLGLLGDGQRKASVLVNIHDTEVIKIPANATQVLKSFWQNQHREIASFLTQRLAPSITRLWTREVMEHVAHKMHEEVFPRGTVLLAQGKESEVRKLYFLKWGDASLLKTIGGDVENSAQIDTLSTGGVFGFVSVKPEVRPKYSVVTTTQVTVLVSATSDLLDVVDEKVVAALQRHMDLFDVDERELSAVLQRGVGWRQWKESLVDDMHAIEYFSKHRIDKMGSLRGVSLHAPNVRDIALDQDPPYTAVSASGLNAGRDAKRKQPAPLYPTNDNSGKKVTFIEKGAEPTKVYQHEPHEKEIAHASSVAAIRQSLSNSLLGRSDLELEEMTEEEKQHYMLEVIENLPNKISEQEAIEEEERACKTGRGYLSFQYPQSYRESANASYFTVAVNPLSHLDEEKDRWRLKAKPTALAKTEFPRVLQSQLVISDMAKAEARKKNRLGGAPRATDIPSLQLPSTKIPAPAPSASLKEQLRVKKQATLSSKSGRVREIRKRIGHVEPAAKFDMKPRGFNRKPRPRQHDSLLSPSSSVPRLSPFRKNNGKTMTKTIRKLYMDAVSTVAAAVPSGHD